MSVNSCCRRNKKLYNYDVWLHSLFCNLARFASVESLVFVRFCTVSIVERRQLSCYLRMCVAIRLAHVVARDLISARWWSHNPYRHTGFGEQRLAFTDSVLYWRRAFWPGGFGFVTCWSIRWRRRYTASCVLRPPIFLKNTPRELHEYLVGGFGVGHGLTS